MIKAYLQDADGNERTLDVTSPDPDDGTYCVHMDDAGQAWIRIVQENDPDDMNQEVPYDGVNDEVLRQIALDEGAIDDGLTDDEK